MANETPIFQDPESNKLYYPERALDDTRKTKRDLITGRIPLKLDKETSRYIAPKTNEPYIEVNDALEFEALKKAHTERKKIIEEQRALAKLTPIYYDLKTDLYFYPKCALTEIETCPRDFVDDMGPLFFNPEIKEYTHRENKEKYIAVGEPDEFERLKSLAGMPVITDEEKLKIGEETPIYLDEKYYYPEIAIEDEIEREVVKGPVPFLKYDPFRKVSCVMLTSYGVPYINHQSKSRRLICTLVLQQPGVVKMFKRDRALDSVWRSNSHD